MHHRFRNAFDCLLCSLVASCSSSDSADPELASNSLLEPAQLEPAPVVARPAAPAPLSVCDLAPDGVTTIERPMFPGRASSPTFGYSFKVHPGTDPAAPTVIHLPGGPGEAAIDVERTAPVPDA